MREALTEADYKSLRRRGYLIVKGGSTGAPYRLKNCRVLNVEQLDACGRIVERWCFEPVGHLVMSDVILAQKLALELFETEVLAVAHRGSDGYRIQPADFIR